MAKDVGGASRSLGQWAEWAGLLDTQNECGPAGKTAEVLESHAADGTPGMRERWLGWTRIIIGAGCGCKITVLEYCIYR